MTSVVIMLLLSPVFRSVVIILLLSPVLSYDNCGDNGYLCGDLCLPKHSDLCICGNETLTISSQEYCCSSQPCTLGPVQYTGFARQNTGTCKTGVPTMLSKTCHGQCNYHPDYKDRNEFTGASETGYHSRSQLPCESGDQCVPEDALCGGVALCHDKSDLEMCEDLDCIYPMLPCSANNSLSTNCYHPDTLTDGVYDCLNRMDEKDIFIDKKETTVDYKSLRTCNQTQY